METFILLSNKKTKISKKFQNHDDRYPEALVKYFVERYTKKGNKVIDIFAGLGTSLFVSEKLGRVPFGIEFNIERFDYIKQKIKHKENIIHGNSLKLDKYGFPKFDLAISSPPYMPKSDLSSLPNRYRKNPFRNFCRGNYKSYLADIGRIYKKLKIFMKKNSHIIIEVSNLKGKDVTTLAWDIGKEISKIFHFEGEVIIGWKTKGTCKGKGTYGYGYDHSYCLVFKNK